MKNIRSAILLLAISGSVQLFSQEKFPDGKIIPDWFYQNEEINLERLGKTFLITDYGVGTDSTALQTEKIQSIIDLASKEEDGGVVVIPQGTFLTGALFFKAGTHLHLEEKAVLKGSDDISNFPIVSTRIEGQSLNYFAALINADQVNGFTISGRGVIDGNGERYWRSFWLRRKVIPKCTNMDELRPRLIHISHSNDVQISGVRLINSPFWTTHIYKCDRVKLLNLSILSPSHPIKAPSSDAIDIDACNTVLIKGCYLSVNDDAVALKGGKGPWADQDSANGQNSDIIIEDCTFGFCHGVLTCGSESIFNHNIILRRSSVNQSKRLLWLKMRPDTPQQFQNVLIEDIKGKVGNCLYISPWTQFYDLKGRNDLPLSTSRFITMRRLDLDCESFLAVKKSASYKLSNFKFENLKIRAKKNYKIEEAPIDSISIVQVEIHPVKE